MNKLTEALTTQFKPSMILVVYQGPREDYYLESHVISPDGVVLEGRPLQQETISDMVDFFFDERQSQNRVVGLLPENLLSFEALPGGKYTMIWYCPAQTRVLYFAKDLHLPSGKAQVPPLIFKVSSGNLYVYAFTEATRPAEDTQLFLAPFHNVSADGHVCLGSAKVKAPSKPTYADIIKYWEDLFFLSEFSHLAGNNNPTVGNLNTIWRSQISPNQLPFPLCELIEYKKNKLKNLL
ncbi:PRTRC system protein B [Chitinophaga jiangningensis]|uniref:PRTRC system protein B n=1 Tax=Chitinophaga jiangningensis TaxID=1419482 RepID=A0A1M6WIY2_9BACT|nr:hypothetical protein [Chitinophaga jiangningensis]SHK93485.1 PRTRC system protein B [Chitinophaga jiangningensis]